MKYSPVDLARQWTFVREVGGQNKGLGPSIFQRFTGNAPGDSWCASFASFILYQAFEGKQPLFASASTNALLTEARQQGWLTAAPEIGDLFFYVHADTGLPHHVGFVTRITPGSTHPYDGIAGNTSADGVSSNGDRVAEHPLLVPAESLVFVHYPR